MSGASTPMCDVCGAPHGLLVDRDLAPKSVARWISFLCSRCASRYASSRDFVVMREAKTFAAPRGFGREAR